ncbi:MAG: hypothetical protein V1835_03215 [Candidatus Micrarchaeota archaeon]
MSELFAKQLFENGLRKFEMDPAGNLTFSFRFKEIEDAQRVGTEVQKIVNREETYRSLMKFQRPRSFSSPSGEGMQVPPLKIMMQIVSTGGKYHELQIRGLGPEAAGTAMRRLLQLRGFGKRKQADVAKQILELEKKSGKKIDLSQISVFSKLGVKKRDGLRAIFTSAVVSKYLHPILSPTKSVFDRIPYGVLYSLNMHMDELREKAAAK